MIGCSSLRASGCSLALGMFLLLAACSYQPGGRTALDTAEAIHSAASNPANYGALVHMEGVVTYYDPAWHLLFLQDASGGIFINLKDEVPGVSAGTRLEVTGTLASSSVGIEDPVFHILGKAPLPQAKRWPEISNDPTDNRFSQWVEVRGVIHTASYEDGRLTLKVVDDGRIAIVRILERKHIRAITLVGQNVRITGVSAKAEKPDNNSSGAQIFASSTDNIEIIGDHTLANPFDMALETFSAALAARPGTFVHLAGVVEEEKPGGVLVIHNGSAKLRILTADHFPLAPGDSIELLGFISAALDYKIEDATVRIVAPRLAANPGAVAGSIRTLYELKSLTVEDAARRLPVDVRGTVTFIDRESSMFFVQDATAAAYVDIHSLGTEARVGDIVRVQGLSAPGDYAPIITRPAITVLGHGRLPKAKELSLQALSAGDSDSSWVQIHGVVHSVQPQKHRFTLAIDGKGFDVQFPLSTDIAGMQDKLLDAEVQVNAVCGTIFNEKRQLIGLKFLVPDPTYIEVLQSAPTDSAVKVRPIVTLLRFDPQNFSEHRVRIRGSVTLQEDPQAFYVQDSSAAIYVISNQKISLKPGHVMEVAGFPVADAEGLYLEDATVVDLHQNSDISPAPLSPEALTSELYDSQLVEIQGRLLERITGSDEDTMMLRAGPLDLRLRLRGKAVPGTIRRGSLLAATGVLQVDGHRGERSFRIALRSPADIRIVQTASWWTPEHAARMLAITTIAILAILLWVLFSAYRVRLHQARHDPLTGLQNRGAALEYLEHQLSRAIREGSPIGIILADVDHFKRINDTLGHQTGDAVLEKIASLLCADLRPYDTVGRYGGEEFLIIVPGCDAALSKEIAERIRLRIMQEKFSTTLPPHALPVTCSFGIANPSGGAWDVDSLLDSADRALYAAKNAGRNAVVLAETPGTNRQP